MQRRQTKRRKWSAPLGVSKVRDKSKVALKFRPNVYDREEFGCTDKEQRTKISISRLGLATDSRKMPVSLVHAWMRKAKE